MPAAFMLSFLCGGAISVQAHISGALSASIHDGFLAAFYTFGSGLVISAAIVVALPSGRAGMKSIPNRVRSHTLPAWYLLAGIGGGIFVLTQGLTVAIIGVALFTVGVVTGQTIAGLVIDARGLGNSAPRHITRLRVIGSLVVIAAALVSGAPHLDGDVPLWVVILPVVAGALSGWQQALNGQVRTVTNSPQAAAFVSFLAGTALLAIIATINVSIVGFPRSLPVNPVLYLGGLFGVIFITGFAISIPIIGVLLQTLAAISGQLIMSLILDVALPTGAGGVPFPTFIGTALTLVGVGIATLRRPPPST